MGSKWDKRGVAKAIEDYWESPEEEEVRREVAEWIGRYPHRRGRLLDVGCGSARMAPLLPQWHYFGVDGSREMIRLAEKRVAAENLRLADISAIPFEDKKFDSALCMQVLRHLAEYKPVLAEMARVAPVRVYIVDLFTSGDTQFGKASVSGVEFLDNVWSLPTVLADIAAAFPGWRTETRPIHGFLTGIKIEAL